MDLRNKILSKKKKEREREKKEKKREKPREAIGRTSHDANALRGSIEFREIASDAKITRPRSRFDRSARLFDRGKLGARKIALKINTLTKCASNDTSISLVPYSF